MSAGQLGPSLLIQHPDEGLLVLVDDLHDPRMTLTEAEQQGLEQERVVKDLVSQELELLAVTEEVQRLVVGAVGSLRCWSHDLRDFLILKV